MILIVDDKPENILSLKAVLELNGFEVEAAYSGEEALKKVLRGDYALIILDVQMPGMDGFEVAEALTGLSRTRDIPIIFLSAVNTHKRFVTKGFESGGIDYLTKPVDADILILKVRTFYRLYVQNKALSVAHKTLEEEVERRRQAQAELSITVEELHTTLESIPQIAFTAKPDGAIDFVNQHWYKLSDSRNEFPQVAPGEPLLEEVWKECIAKGNPYRKELRIVDKPGNVLFFLMQVMPVTRDNAIQKWVGTFTDITEQKLLSHTLERKVAERTHELVEMNRELETTNHDLQQFASVASHDLKEPLRKIQLFSNMIVEKEDVSPGTQQFLEKIIQSSARMATLINDLLAVTRLSEAALFEKTNLNELINDALNDLELTIIEKRAVIRQETLPEVEVIPGLFRQLFLNIVSNAIKFAKDGVSPEISITGERVDSAGFAAVAQADGPFCRIRIADNGIGFDDKYVSKIFTLFQRLNHRDAYEGTGIGLAIVKKIVDKHHGQITAESQPGAGATFIIQLPVEQAIRAVPVAEHL